MINLLLITACAGVMLVSGIDRYWTIASPKNKRTIHLVGALHNSPDASVLIYPMSAEELTIASLNQFVFTSAVIDAVGVNGFSAYYTEIEKICPIYAQDTTRTFGTENLFCNLLVSHGTHKMGIDHFGLESLVSQLMVSKYATVADLLFDWRLSGQSRLLYDWEATGLVHYPYLIERLLVWQQNFKILAWTPSLISSILDRTLWAGSAAVKSLYPKIARLLSGMYLSGHFNTIWTMNYQIKSQRNLAQQQKEQEQTMAHLSTVFFKKNVCPKLEDFPSHLDLKSVKVLLKARDLNMAEQALSLLETGKPAERSGIVHHFLSWLNQLFKSGSSFAVYENGLNPVKNLRTAISDQVFSNVKKQIQKDSGTIANQCPSSPHIHSGAQCDRNADQNILIVVGALHLPGMIEAMQKSSIAEQFIFTPHNATMLIESHYETKMRKRKKSD